MTGAEWIAEKINSPGKVRGVEATVECENVVFLRRTDRPDAHIGVIPTKHGEPAPLVGLADAKEVRAQKPAMAMIIAIPRGARWSGATMTWLKSKRIAFGGVSDLLSAISHDDDLSTHRNKTLAFVNDGLLRHSCVENLKWIDSKKVKIFLSNDVTVTVALDDSYDVTMNVAREAARILGDFQILLKTNPNGSITSNGAESIKQLGFQTLNWGELFGYLAKKGRQTSNDDLRKRLQRTRSTT